VLLYQSPRQEHGKIVCGSRWLTAPEIDLLAIRGARVKEMMQVTEFRNGHAPFPETLVISSERSGLNLVRHACEVMSGRRTPGKVHLVKDGPLLFHRTHYAGHAGAPVGPFAPLFEPGGKCNYTKALLLLREPAETFVRAYDKKPDLMKRYCRNIKLFDSFPGEKLVVTYDELVTSDSALLKIFSFLGIADCFNASKLAETRQDAVAWYDKNQPSGSQTRGDPSLLKAHQSALTPQERALLQDFLRQELGSLAPLYLATWGSF
jgi:hypothetical protein